MKKKNVFLKAFFVAALVVVIGFGLIGCPGDNNNNNDNDNNNNNNSNSKPLFSVSGEFKGAGSGNALFKAATAETVSRAARAATTSYELTGELEDGDMLFRLKGTYDFLTGKYTASSASSIARYTINGDANGATATLAVKSGEEWTSFIVSVTVKEVSTKDGDAQDYAGGLPSWAQGSWHDWWAQNKNNYNENSFEAWSYFNQWYYEAYKSSVYNDNWDSTSTKYTVVEAQQLSDGKYDVIFSYPFYKANEDQRKTALENFFRDNNHPAEFWNKKFLPWDHDVWTGSGEAEGKNYDNSLIWYICMNENHAWHSGSVIINWDTTFFDTQKEQDEFYDEFYRLGYDQDLEWWEKKEAVEEFLASKDIPSYYYWGWHEPDYDPDADHEKRRYTCWEPACEDGWWDKTHYYLTGGWSNQNGIQGDWDRYRDLFNKWSSDDYLITYLRSQNVQPETWYTRVRMWKDGDTLMFQYYNGDSEANESHSAPACDTKSLSKIKSKTFDSNYWGYGNFWQSKRTSPRN